MDSLIDAIGALAKAGPAGLVASGLLFVLVIWGSIKYRKFKNEAAHKKTQKRRSEAEAANPGENARDEADMISGEDEIDRMFNDEGDS